MKMGASPTAGGGWTDTIRVGRSTAHKLDTQTRGPFVNCLFTANTNCHNDKVVDETL